MIRDLDKITGAGGDEVANHGEDRKRDQPEDQPLLQPAGLDEDLTQVLAGQQGHHQDHRDDVEELGELIQGNGLH